MATKRVTITDEEQRVILDALKNQLWTYDIIKQQYTDIEDTVIDRQKAEVENVYKTMKVKFKKYYHE